jgi:hypothetical protein
MIRAWGKIRGFTPKEVFDQIYDTENRQKWDTITNNIRVVESLGDDTEVIYFIIKAPFVSNRDFVQRRNFQFDYPKKDHIIMSFVSVTHPAFPPVKGNVRGETHIAGYVIKPNDEDRNSTDICVLSQCDVKVKKN